MSRTDTTLTETLPELAEELRRLRASVIETPPERLTLDDLRRERPAISIPRAAEYLDIARETAYAMARQGRLPTIKIGPRRVQVPTIALLRMLTGED